MGQLLSDIGSILLPTRSWDIFIYLVFFLALIATLFIPDKNLTPSLIMTGVLLFALVDKVRTSGAIPIAGLEDTGFVTMLLHVAMFVLPLISAGMIRGRGRKDKRAVGPSLLAGVIAGVYFVFFQITINPIGQAF